ARGATDAAPRADERGRHPHPHLVQDVRPDFRHGPARPPDRDAGDLHVVHDVRRVQLQPWRGHRDPAHGWRIAGDRPVHLVLDAGGAAAVSTNVDTPRDLRIRSQWSPHVTTARYIALFALVCL